MMTPAIAAIPSLVRRIMPAPTAVPLMMTLSPHQDQSNAPIAQRNTQADPHKHHEQFF
jgi:hypothetical protein